MKSSAIAVCCRAGIRCDVQQELEDEVVEVRYSVMRKCAMINVRSMSDDEVRMVVT